MMLGTGRVGVHRSRACGTAADFSRNQGGPVHWTLLIILSLCHIATPLRRTVRQSGETWLALRFLSKRGKAAYTSEVDPNIILMFSLCAGPGSVSTHHFLRFSVKHIVGKCYFQ